MSITSAALQTIPSEVRNTYSGPNMVGDPSTFPNSEVLGNTLPIAYVHLNRADAEFQYRSSPSQEMSNRERIENAYLNMTGSRMAPAESRILLNLMSEQIDQQMRSIRNEFGCDSGLRSNAQYSNNPHADRSLLNRIEEFDDFNLSRDRMALAQSRILRNIPPPQQIHSNAAYSGTARNQMAPQHSTSTFDAPSDQYTFPNSHSQSRMLFNSPPARHLPPNLQEASYGSPYPNAAERQMTSASLQGHSFRDASENNENRADEIPNMLNNPIEFAKWCQKKFDHE